MTSRYVEAWLKLAIIAGLAIIAASAPARAQDGRQGPTTAAAGTSGAASGLVSSPDSLRRMLALRPEYVADPVRIMIVGTFRFANPGRDMVNPDAGDILSAGRQAEIERLVDDLAAFAPDEVALEVPSERDASVQAHYRAVREGRTSPWTGTNATSGSSPTLPESPNRAIVYSSSTAPATNACSGTLRR